MKLDELEVKQVDHVNFTQLQSRELFTSTQSHQALHIKESKGNEVKCYLRVGCVLLCGGGKDIKGLGALCSVALCVQRHACDTKNTSEKGEKQY